VLGTVSRIQDFPYSRSIESLPPMIKAEDVEEIVTKIMQ
jgi:hypothetical protein